MVNYTCYLCNNIFTNKTHYNQHKKTKCNEKIELNLSNDINNNNNEIIVDMKKE